MPPVQVRDCPQEIYERLKASAKEDNRSITQQTLHILESYLDYRYDGDAAAEYDSSCAERPARPTGRSGPWPRERRPVERSWAPPYESGAEIEARKQRKREIFARIDALPKFDVPDDFPSVEQIVREMRDER